MDRGLAVAAGTANGKTPTENKRGDTEENTRTTTTHVTKIHKVA